MPRSAPKWLWKKVRTSVSASDSVLNHFGVTWSILVDFGKPQNPGGCQKRSKKINTATFWHPKAAGRRKNVDLEGAWKINRNLDWILVRKMRPRSYNHEQNVLFKAFTHFCNSWINIEMLTKKCSENDLKIDAKIIKGDIGRPRGGQVSTSITFWVGLEECQQIINFLIGQKSAKDRRAGA